MKKVQENKKRDQTATWMRLKKPNHKWTNVCAHRVVKSLESESESESFIDKLRHTVLALRDYRANVAQQ